MLRKLAVLATLFAFIGVSLPALADAPLKTANQRQARQEHRIRQGARSGQLTHREARKLQRQQRHIRKMKRRARRDGKVTRREKRRINRAQNRANRNIRRKKHNRRVRRRDRK